MFDIIASAGLEGGTNAVMSSAGNAAVSGGGSPLCDQWEQHKGRAAAPAATLPWGAAEERHSRLGSDAAAADQCYTVTHRGVHRGAPPSAPVLHHGSVLMHQNSEAG